MIDFDKPFICNRNFLKAEYRESLGYSLKDVCKEFIDVLEHTPVQTHIPKTRVDHSKFNPEEYKNFLDELYGLEETILWSEAEDDEQAFEDYIYPYAALFLITKEYDDAQMSYMYVAGAYYCNPWNLCDETTDATEVLDAFYENKLTRQKVFDMVARFLVSEFMYYEETFPYVNFHFSFKEYEEQIAEREAKEKDKE